MRYTIMLILLFIITEGFSQLEIEWAKRYNGVAEFIDNPGNFAIDNQDNVFVTGNTFINNTTNGYDIILIKYSSNGEKLWETAYSHGQGNDNALNINLLNDNIYLTCTYPGMLYLLKFDTDGNFLTENVLRTGSNYFVETFITENSLLVKTNYTVNYDIETFELIKCDLNGNIVWTYGNEPNTIILDIKIDNLGNIILCGSKDYVFSPISQMYVGDALLVKISNDGNLIWEAQIDNNTNPEIVDIVQKIAIDDQNNIYAVVNNDFVSKFNVNGEIVWNNRFVHTNYERNTIQNIEFNNQKLFMNGYSWSNAANPNILTICYDLQGVAEWYNNYFTTAEFSGTQISSLNFDNNGNVYSVGYKHDIGNRHDIYLKAYTTDGTDFCQFTYNSTGDASESVKNVLIKNNKIYLLVNSSQDILTIKLNNPFVNVGQIATKKVNIYPNPTKGISTCELTDGMRVTKLLVRDIAGKVIIEIKEPQDIEQFDLSGFERGLYLISVQTEHEVYTTKIIKE